MNTNTAASELEKDTDLYDQWAAMQQMKCNVDKHIVIYIGLQNDQTKYKKNVKRKNEPEGLMRKLEIPVHSFFKHTWTLKLKIIVCTPYLI